MWPTWLYSYRGRTIFWCRIVDLSTRSTQHLWETETIVRWSVVYYFLQSRSSVVNNATLPIFTLTLVSFQDGLGKNLIACVIHKTIYLLGPTKALFKSIFFFFFCLVVISRSLEALLDWIQQQRRKNNVIAHKKKLINLIRECNQLGKDGRWVVHYQPDCRVRFMKLSG